MGGTAQAKARTYQLKLLGSGCTLDALVRASIETLRFYLDESGGAYELCFSGGKDSVTLKRLADMAGVPYTALYHVTTIDPPELVRFIRTEHPDVVWDRPKVPFFALMPRRGIPTRKARWCCQEFKERPARVKGRVQVCGIRAAESRRRAQNWSVFTTHRIRRGKRTERKSPMLNPILHWPDDAVWEFIRREKVPYCKLYDQGFKRLGCIGCPMARGTRIVEFARWPRYARLWRKAFQALWDRKAGTMQRNGQPWWFSARFDNADAAFAWWLSDDSAPQVEDESCIGLW